MAYTNEQLGKALEDLTNAYNNFVEKAKDAAIKAMGETVIKQIKKDAKDYIASELHAQKTAIEQAVNQSKLELNQAIEQAKRVLQNTALDEKNAIKQISNEKKNELAALITAAENALQAKVEDAQNKYKALADTEQTKLKELAASSKDETQQAVTQAKKELKEQGEAITMKISKDIKEQLNVFADDFGKKIIDAKDEIKTVLLNTNKALVATLENQITKMINNSIYIDAVDCIKITTSSSSSPEIMVKSLKNTPLTASAVEKFKSTFNGNDFFNIKEPCGVYFNIDKFRIYREKKDDYKYTHIIYGNTIEYIYIKDTSSIALFDIDNFYFLKKIIIGRGSTEHIRKIAKVTNCPNFQGFEEG